MPETVEIRMTKEELGYVMAGLTALRRDFRKNAGSDLCMARVIGKEVPEVCAIDGVAEGLVGQADRAIEESNKVNVLLDRIKIEVIDKAAAKSEG